MSSLRTTLSLLYSLKLYSVEENLYISLFPFCAISIILIIKICYYVNDKFKIIFKEKLGKISTKWYLKKSVKYIQEAGPDICLIVVLIIIRCLSSLTMLVVPPTTNIYKGNLF
jgi:hypothetical protein